MARRGFRQLFNGLLEQYGQAVAEAFLKAIEEIRSAVRVQRVIARLEARDIEGALAELNLEPAAYGEMLDRMRDAYLEGGRLAAADLPTRRPDGGSLVIRFDGRNYRAEEWLRDRSSRLVSRTIEDQKQAVRQTLTSSLEQGVNPRQAALRVVGTINPISKQREGGILGLTTAQEQYVRTAREELTAGDPASLRNYLNRGRRDQRFDRTIEKALRDGTPVPAETVAKAVRQYENRLLKLRGDTIARTETLAALNAASHEAILQAVDAGKIDAAAVRRVWRSAGDLRVRHTHQALHSESVGLTEVFVSPSGARMRYPGDTSLGAPASETIACRCVVENRIDFLANLR